MFRKDNKAFPKSLGIAYILFQCLGAFLAGLFILFFTNGGITSMSLVPYCMLCNTDPNNGNC